MKPIPHVLIEKEVYLRPYNPDTDKSEMRIGNFPLAVSLVYDMRWPPQHALWVWAIP